MSPAARQRLRRWLTLDTTSAALLLIAAVAALVWINSPWGDGYRALSAIVVGPEVLHLSLPLSAWASDGLLAIFFFVVGVELKHEFIAGSLRNPRQAAVPMLAAVGGMAVPALVFAAVVSLAGDTEALHGWAIPTATDIAFALAVLAVFGRGLPVALRVFLLTLAVVDDLLAIVIIAVFYTASIDILMLALALATVVLFALLARARWAAWWNLQPVAVAAWGLMHASGVHATIAAVLLGLVVPARALHGETHSRAVAYEHAVRPWSSAVALPLFAFFAAGVSVVEGGGPAAVLAQPVVLAIVAGLVIGKVVGVLGTTALVTRLTPLRLADSVGLRDLAPIGLLTGIGFTVSLLIAELSFPDGEHTDAAKLAVLLATALAATGAAVLLRWDARRARRSDMNDDGVEDAPGELIGDEA